MIRRILYLCTGLVFILGLWSSQQLFAQQFSRTQLSETRGDLATATSGTKIMFAGGDNGAQKFATVDIYDTETDAWLSTHNLSEARGGLAGAALGTKIIFAGGYGLGYSDAVDIYDTQTRSWTSHIFTLSEARRDLAGAALGTKIMFAGGMDSNGYSDAVDIYDTQTNAWTIHSLSEARAHLAAAALGTKIMFAGGFASGSGSTNIVDIYDTETGAWTQYTLSEARSYLAAAALGTKIMFAGGQTNGGGYSDAVDIYDTETGAWTTHTLSEARKDLVGVAVGTKIIFAGGMGDNGSSDMLDIYDTETEQWSTGTLGMGGILYGIALETEVMFTQGGIVDIFDLSTPVPEPASLSPGIGAVIEPPINLSWDDENSDYEFEFHLSSQPDFSDTLHIESEISTPHVRLWQSYGLEENQTYYWRVRAYHRDINWFFSKWLNNEFTLQFPDEIAPPVVLAPDNGSFEEPPFSLSWEEETEGGYIFNLHISSRSDFSDTLRLENFFPDGNAYEVTQDDFPEGNKTYYWSLRRQINTFPELVSNWVSRRFTMTADVPVLTSPAASADVELPDTLVWEQETNPDEFTFNVHVSSQPDFSDTLRYEANYEGNRLPLSQTDGFRSGETYYWQIRRQGSIDSTLVSDWASSSFRVEVETPVLTGPSDGASLQPFSLLSWEQETRPSEYVFDVHISSTSNFSDTLHYESSYTFYGFTILANQLETGETYYWRIRRHGVANPELTSDWASRSFMIEMNSPVLTGPDDGAALEPFDILSWQEEPDPDKFVFNVHLASLADFTDTLHYESSYTDNELIVAPDLLETGQTYYWQVRRKVTSNPDLISEWVSRSFSAEVDAPVLTGPEAGATFELPDTLSWAQETKPDEYTFNLHISSASDFSDTLRYEPAYEGNELALTQADGFELGQAYYWRVRRHVSTNAELASDWVERNFVVGVTTPVLAGPEDGAVVETPMNLAWSQETNPGAYTFDVHISTQSDFSDTLRYETDYTDNELELTQLDGYVNGETYHWRVRRQGVTDQNLISAWAERSFVAEFVVGVAPPVLAGPGEGGVFELPDTLSWIEEPLPDEYNFNVHISTKPDFSDTLHYEAAYASNEMVIAQDDSLKQDSIYYWRVRRRGTVNPDLISAWEERSFVVEVGTPVLSGPEDGAVLEPSDVLSWEPEPKPGEYIFDVHISTQSDFSDTLRYESSYIASELTLAQSDSLLNNQVHYWRVRRQGTKDEDLISDWVYRTFTMQVEVPVIQFPQNGTGIEPPFSLAWSDNGHPDYRFRFHLSSHPNFSDTLRYDSTLTVKEVMLTSSDSLKAGQTYYWRVRKQGTNNEDLISSWTEGNFKVKVGTPSLLEPADEARRELPVTLRWDSTPKEGYQLNVQISTDPDFQNGMIQDTTFRMNELGEITESLLLDNLKTNETYYWHVRRQSMENPDLASEWVTRQFYIRPDFIRLTEDSTFVFLPNYVNVMFHATDADNKGIIGLDDPDFKVFADDVDADDPFFEGDYEIDSLAQIPVNTKVVLLLDNSSSLGLDLNNVKEAAKRFIRTKPQEQEIAIYVFSSFLEKISDFTTDTTALINGIDGIGLGGGSTTLYESIIEMFSKWDDSFSLSRIEQGFLVVFSDGDDTALTLEVEDVVAARGNKQVFTVGFGGGVTPSILEQIGNAGSFYEADDINNLGGLFENVQQDLIQLSKSYYWLNFESPRQGNIERELLISVKGNTNTGIDSELLVNYSSKGFYQPPPEIAINRTAELPGGVDSITMAADDTVNVNVQSPFNFQVLPLSFDISDPEKLSVKANPDELFTYTFTANGFEGDQIEVVITDTVVTDLAPKTLTVNFTAPEHEALPPAVVGLESPADGSTGVLLAPVLQWNQAENTFSYRLQVSTAFDFTSVVLDTIVTGTSVVSDSLEEQTQYYWRVQSLNRGLEADWSEVWSFTTRIKAPEAIVLRSPLGPEVETGGAVRFVWDQPEQVVNKYRFQLTQNNDFSSPVVDSLTTETELDIEGLTDGTEYEWRVQAINDGGEGAFSHIVSFTYRFVAGKPGRLTLLSPADGAISRPLEPELSWNSTELATSYQVQIALDNEFLSFHKDTTVTGTSLQVEDLDYETTYYWHARALNNEIAGEWAEAFSFTTGSELPDIVTLLKPGAAAILENSAVTFSWEEPAFDYNTFNLQVSTSQTFGSTVLDSTVTDVVVTADGFEEGDYYWRVRPQTDRNHSGWSEVRSFSVRLIVIPEEVVVQATRTFGDAAGPQDYRLVALPGNISESLAAVLTGEAGVEWQAFWDTGAEQDYLMKYDGSGTFTVEPGNGFWVTSKEAFEYSETIPAMELNNQNQALIPLHEGWNIISNPLDIDVPWNEIQAANGGDLQPVWGFEGSFREPAGFTSAKTGEAFYFLNDQELEKLVIPYIPVNAKVKSKSKSTPAPKQERQKQQEIRLITLVEGKETSSSRLVFVAPDKKKRPDAVAPPAGFEGASLRFAADTEKQKSRRSKAFAHLYREFNPDGQSFKMILTAPAGEPVTIKVEGWDATMSAEIALINEQTGRQYDFKKKSEILFTPKEKTTTFLLVIGDADYLKQQQDQFLPTVIEVMQNYPNPFRSRTNLRFGLPEQTRVRLVVYDILGRKVATLLNEVREAGDHTIPFDAGRYASGVYFTVFEIDGKRFVKKMMLIK